MHAGDPARCRADRYPPDPGPATVPWRESRPPGSLPEVWPARCWWRLESSSWLYIPITRRPSQPSRLAYSIRTSAASGSAPFAVDEMAQFLRQGRRNRPFEFRAHSLKQPLDAGQGLRRHGLRVKLSTYRVEQFPHAHDALGRLHPARPGSLDRPPQCHDDPRTRAQPGPGLLAAAHRWRSRSPPT